MVMLHLVRFLATPCHALFKRWNCRSRMLNMIQLAVLSFPFLAVNCQPILTSYPYYSNNTLACDDNFRTVAWLSTHFNMMMGHNSYLND